MSLRIRLSFIISLLFLACMLLGTSFLISNAKQRIANEVTSTSTLTFQLLDTLLPDSSNTDKESDLSALLRKLNTLEDARHMEISISNQETNSTYPSQRAIDAPNWFVKLVESEILVFSRPLNNANDDVITIRTNQADEIAEVWQETRIFLLLLLLVLLILNSILFLTIGRWFTPVKTILNNLEDVEHNRFSEPLVPNALPELRVIADKVTKLSQVLRASREENDRLSSRSLRIQEEERRHLARELHDEMGQSISAIKAIAFSISERNSDDEMSREGASRIGSISNHVRDHIRSMMHRLRPSVLDELGLVLALEHMIDEWNRNHSSSFCSLRTTGNYDDLTNEQQIHLYRIAQEALTNVAAHAEAETVDITMDRNNDKLQLQIKDHGKGFDVGTYTPGMGLSGMKERVRAIQGQWSLHTLPGSGVTIEISFPIQAQHFDVTH